jgi:hypothetical protein
MPLSVVRRAALGFTLLALPLLGLTGCKTPAPFPMSRAPGTTCGDPCAVLQCPSGQVCTWNEQCQPHCELQLPPVQFSR